MARTHFRPALGTLAALPALVGLVAVTGCAPRQPDPCRGPYPYSVTHEEIDAASRLTFDSSKADALGRIAGRPGLAPHEQQHLVMAVVDGLAFEASRADVLRKLIGNPGFAPPAKACILRHLDRFAFDSTRADLLKAMDGRGDADRVPDGGDPPP